MAIGEGRQSIQDDWREVMRMEWGNHLPRHCRQGGWVVHDANCLCRYLRMKIGRDCVGLGGA